MIEGLKPYSDYKDSGLSWARELPRHWHLRRLKTVFREVDQRSKTGRETLLSLRAKSGLVDHHGLGGRVIPPESLINYKRVKPGQIVMNRMRASAGLFAIPPQEGLVSPDYSVLSPQAECSLRYFVELFKTPQMGAIFRAESHGLGTGESGFLRLYFNSFGPITAPFPPKEEQEAIVRFLAHANQKIDGFIRAKRKLIGLLNEQKQAIIHQAVTRGIDPSVPLKPSGIPWLGDIPKHWGVRRLKTLVYRIEQGISPQASGFLAEGDSWGVLKSGCVNHGVFRQTEHKQLAKGFTVDPAIVVKVGDVLISRACGSPKLVGSVGKVQSLHYKLILSDKTFRAVFRPIVNADFMVYAMNASYYRQQVEQAISGAEGMANNLPLSELRSFIFAVPPFDEAKMIASALDGELAQFNTAITRREREISLMQEYRTRLTADLVTGRLDVREAASKLPEVDDAASEDTGEDELVDAEEIDPYET